MKPGRDDICMHMMSKQALCWRYGMETREGKVSARSQRGREEICRQFLHICIIDREEVDLYHD